MTAGRPRLPTSTLPALVVAVALAVLPVVFPVELHPWSRAFLMALCGVAAFVLALRPAGVGAAVRDAAVLCLPLGLASVLGAACRARAIDESALLVALLIAGLLGYALRRQEGAQRVVLGLLAALGCMAAIQAALQHHLIYPEEASHLRATLAQNGETAGALLLRLESGRPSGPFILPAALGGFLALSFPALMVWAFRSRRIAVRAVAVGALVLQGYALCLSRSLGSLAALSVGLLLVLPILAPRRMHLAAAGVVLMIAVLIVPVVHARWGEIGRDASNNPLELRARNWEAAGRMIVDHPLLGVGPGSFGTFYPRYMRQGMNETRFAHNSYLQVAATWGLWALLPIGVLLGGFARRARCAFAAADPCLTAFAGAAAFLVHNLVDFTAFMPGIAIPSAVLVGLSIGAGRVGSTDPVETGRVPLLPGLATALCVALVCCWPALRSWRCETLLAAAEDAAKVGDVAGAVDAAHRAAAARPAHPDPWAFLAQLVLAHGMDDPQLRAAGERAAARAVLLDPEAAVLHYTRSLYYRAAGEGAAAFRTQRQAHLLYPLKPLYELPAGPGEGSSR